MFSLPYPYAETPEKRNASRTGDITQNLGNLIGELRAQLEAATELRDSLTDGPWAEAAKYGYQRAEWVGRHFDQIGNSQRRIDDLILTSAVIAGGYENEEVTGG